LASAFCPPLAAHAEVKEITMAYFLEWPLPFERAKVEGTFEKELGVKVNWRSFATGAPCRRRLRAMCNSSSAKACRPS
jgi:taurine transport system substrate-binding protein